MIGKCISGLGLNVKTSSAHWYSGSTEIIVFKLRVREFLVIGSLAVSEQSVYICT